MSNKMKIYSNYEIEQSEKYMLSLCDNANLRKRVKHADIKDKYFEKKLDLRETLRGNFIECEFNKIPFNDADCMDYYFNNCKLYDCMAENSNFKYLGMVDCTVTNIESNGTIINDSFGYSILENSVFKHLNISACEFQNIQVRSCILNDIICDSCDFKGSLIHNTSIKNVDFTKSDIQFVDFVNVKVKNTSFLIEDILHCFNGLEMIQDNSNDVTIKLFSDSKEVSGKELIVSLDRMIPYLYSISDFFALANISLYKEDSSKAFQYILMGLKYYLEQKDFGTIRHLCKLASSTPLFAKKELKAFYNALKSDYISSQLNRFEYRHYIQELEEIKYLLIDNPSNLIQMTVVLQTTIYEYDYDAISNVLKNIDDAANLIIPQTPKSVSIRHNSSPILEIVLNNSIIHLIPFFAFLCAVFGRSIKYIHEIIELLNQKAKLDGQMLSNDLKKAELAEQQLAIRLKESELQQQNIEKQILFEKLKQTEQQYKNNINTYNVSGGEISNISYDLKSDSMNIPHGIRHMNFSITTNIAIKDTAEKDV